MHRSKPPQEVGVRGRGIKFVDDDLWWCGSAKCLFSQGQKDDVSAAIGCASFLFKNNTFTAQAVK